MSARLDIRWLLDEEHEGRYLTVSDYERRFLLILADLYKEDDPKIEKKDRLPNLKLLEHKSVLINRYLKRKVPRYHEITLYLSLFVNGRIDELVPHIHAKYRDHFADLTKLVTEDHIVGRGATKPFQFPFIKDDPKYNHEMASTLRSFMLFMPRWLFYGFPIEYWYTVTYSVMMRRFLTNNFKDGLLTREDKDPLKDVVPFRLFPSLYHDAYNECKREIESIKEHPPLFTFKEKLNSGLSHHLIRLRRAFFYSKRSPTVEDIVLASVNQVLDLYKDLFIDKPKVKEGRIIVFSGLDIHNYDALIQLMKVIPFETSYISNDSDREKGIVSFEVVNRDVIRLMHSTLYQSHYNSLLPIRPLPDVYFKCLELLNVSIKRTISSDLFTFEDRMDQPNETLFLFKREEGHVKSRLKEVIDLVIENDIRPSQSHKELISFAVRKNVRMRVSSFYRYLKDKDKIDKEIDLSKATVRDTVKIGDNIVIIQDTVVSKDVDEKANIPFLLYEKRLYKDIFTHK